MNNVLFVIAFGMDGLMHICRTFSETRKKQQQQHFICSHLFFLHQTKMVNIYGNLRKMCAFHISFVAMECRFVGENVNFFENVKKYETQKWKPKIRRKHKESKADAIQLFLDEH